MNTIDVSEMLDIIEKELHIREKLLRLKELYSKGAQNTNAWSLECDLRDRIWYCKTCYEEKVYEEINKMYEEIFPLRCPKEGSFIGYKKALIFPTPYSTAEALVTLEIPEDAKRSSAFEGKCRCSKAKVLSIENIHVEGLSHDYAYSAYVDKHRLCFDKQEPDYYVGDMVYPDSFDEFRWNECSNGIHFFMTKEEALEYKI